MAALAAVSLIPFVAGVQAGRQPGSHSAREVVARIVPQTASAAEKPQSVSRARFNAMRHLAYVRGKRIKQLKRTLLHTPTVTEAINLSCATYGFCSTLWRKARCESGLSADPPHNNDARGLFQFIDSTFASTPYAGFSIFSPYANALAAGWMHAHGRGGEWTCQ